jgi:hypothetical protein
MKKKRVLLLVGSPRTKASTSAALGEYLSERLRARGAIVESLTIGKDHGEIAAALTHVELLVLAFPLYVDSLPHPLIRTLEFIAEHRGMHRSRSPQRLAVLVNCGFPEAGQNATAVSICRRFALETGFDWAGGLALGGGDAIGGRPLRKIEFMARNVIAALDSAAESLVRGESIPEKAISLMAKPLVPRWLYTFIGNHNWRVKAKKYGMKERLGDRPFADS